MKQEIVMITRQNTILKIFYLCALLSANYLYAIDNLKIEPVNKVADKLSIYRFQFTTTTPLAADAQLEISFTGDFDLSRIIAASSKNIPGGFSVRRSDNKVFITRTGLGKAIPAGETVEILLANVINPPTPGKNYVLNLTVKSPVGASAETAAAPIDVQEQTTE